MTTIHVAPEVPTESCKVRPDNKKTLQEALDDANPGDVIQLGKGCYRQPVILRRSGTAKRPITILGRSGNGSLLDGGRQVNQLPRERPDPDAFAFLTLEGARHVIVEKLAFDNNFPTAIRLKNTYDITIRSCVFTRFSYAIAAGENYKPDETEAIVVDDCRAIQDPESDLWLGRVSWQDVKHKVIHQQDKRHRNGAFFRATNIVGNVLIHKTNISQCFNGIHLWNRYSDPRRNRNIFITRCRFAYIRDNAVEPEWRVDNLWVVDNTFHNCHNPFSMDWVTGSHRYYLGNTIYCRVRPGAHHQANRGGSIYKVTPNGHNSFPEREFYSAFNSVLTRTEYVKQGSTRHWTHANNAISILREGPHTDPDKRLFGAEFTPDESLNFFGDVTDHPDAAASNPFFANTRTVEGPMFEEPRERPEFLGTTDAWDGQLILHGEAADVNSVEMQVGISGEDPVTVPSGYRLDSKTPPALMAAFKRQSTNLSTRLKTERGSAVTPEGHPAETGVGG